MKKYPLDIEYMTDRWEDVIGYMSKGHHDRATFARLATEMEQAEGGGHEWMDVEVGQDWWRVMPAGKSASYDLIFVSSKPGRGAFPVTYVRI